MLSERWRCSRPHSHDHAQSWYVSARPVLQSLLATVVGKSKFPSCKGFLGGSPAGISTISYRPLDVCTASEKYGCVGGVLYGTQDPAELSKFICEAPRSSCLTIPLLRCITVLHSYAFRGNLLGRTNRKNISENIRLLPSLLPDAKIALFTGVGIYDYCQLRMMSQWFQDTIWVGCNVKHHALHVARERGRGARLAPSLAHMPHISPMFIARGG